jgi:hypothetical protein
MRDPSLCAILCHEQISVSYLRASTSSSRPNGGLDQSGSLMVEERAFVLAHHQRLTPLDKLKVISVKGDFDG